MTFPLDFPELNDFGAGFLGQKQAFEKSVSVGTIPNFRRLDPDHGDYALRRVNPQAVRINGRALATNTPFLAPSLDAQPVQRRV